MTALYITGGILIFIFLILMMPISFRFKYEGEPELFLRYLFIKIRLVPPKEKKNKPPQQEKEQKKPEEKKKKKEKSPFKILYEKQGLDGLLNIAKEAAAIVTNTSSGILRHTVIGKLKIDLVIVGDDAADTALKYGYACTGIYPAVSVIDSNMKLKRKEIDIAAGFNEPEMKIFVESKASIRPLFLLGTAISAAVKGIKLILKIKNDIE